MNQVNGCPEQKPPPLLSIYAANGLTKRDKHPPPWASHHIHSLHLFGLKLLGLKVLRRFVLTVARFPNLLVSLFHSSVFILKVMFHPLLHV